MLQLLVLLEMIVFKLSQATTAVYHQVISVFLLFHVYLIKTDRFNRAVQMNMQYETHFAHKI